MARMFSCRIRRSIVTGVGRRHSTRRSARCFSAARGRLGFRPVRRTAGGQHRGQQQ
jgi:hypothetical protein